MDANFEYVQLLVNQRQVGEKDAQLRLCLSEVRVDEMSDETIEYFSSELSRPLPMRKDGIKPTTLYCKNADVDYMNNHEV